MTAHRLSPAFCMIPYIATLGLAVAADATAVADSESRFAGASALVVQPENSFWGYDATIQSALMQRGLEVTQAPPEVLADPEALQAYDLIATNLKRSFTPQQVAGIKTYLALGGALYGNWGGPMGCPELLRVFGAKSARSVYIRELTLTDSPLTQGLGELRWAFPDFAGHARLSDKGQEMVAFELADGIETARDSEGRCLGTLREQGAGRCALLGFCPSNFRFLTDNGSQAGAVLDNLLSWLLPRGSKPRPLPQTIKVSLPRRARVSAVSINDLPLELPEVRPAGSLATFTLPVGAMTEGQTASIHVDIDLPAGGRNVETWIHDPVASSFNSFEPAEAANFLASLHTSVVQPLLRYEGGSIAYTRGIEGDRPRDRFAKYEGDLLAEYITACHARGIKVIGGLYLDWKRFTVHLADAPPQVAKNQAPPEPAAGQRVCPLGAGVQEHNLGIVENLLDNYPELDGLILDDNFEFDTDPCYCAQCLGKFADYCQRQDLPLDPNAEMQSNGPAWKAFWKAEKLAFCKRVRDACAVRGKPVGGWTAQRGPLAFRGVFDFAGNMVYVEPPWSVAPLMPLLGDFPTVTLLWGMNRKPAEMESDLVEAIRSGSDAVGFWIGYSRQEGITDNRWSLATRPGDVFALTPGSITAIERAFAGAEQTWRDYYRDNLIQGDPRFVVTGATLKSDSLTLDVSFQSRPSAKRVVGPVDLSGLPAANP